MITDSNMLEQTLCSDQRDTISVGSHLVQGEHIICLPDQQVTPSYCSLLSEAFKTSYLPARTSTVTTDSTCIVCQKSVLKPYQGTANCRRKLWNST